MLYNEYINNILNTRGRFNCEGYKERHHISPRCKGGTNDKDNLIDLYAREHFIAHKLLAEENPDDRSLVFAWSRMAFQNNSLNRDYELTPEEYEEARELQSKALKGNTYFLKNGHPWNYGLTSETDERVKNYGKKGSAVLKGRKMKPFTEEHKLHMSIAAKNRDWSNFKSHALGKVAITNGKITKFIDPQDPIPDGFTFGNCYTRGKHDLSNYYSNPEMQKIRRELSSGKNNNMYGQGHKVSGGKNGKAVYIYTFEGVDYQCRDDLMVVLKNRWPTISESTIRAIQSNTYTTRISKKYQYVIDNMSWRLKDKYANKVNK